MGCLVPQPSATRGNQFYPYFLAVTGGPRYSGNNTPILSLQDSLSVWYFCRLSIAFSMSNSSKSLASTSVGQNIASAIVHALSCLISFWFLFLSILTEVGKKFSPNF
jgi:hypothetical protein